MNPQPIVKEEEEEEKPKSIQSEESNGMNPSSQSMNDSLLLLQQFLHKQCDDLTQNPSMDNDVIMKKLQILNNVVDIINKLSQFFILWSCLFQQNLKILKEQQIGKIVPIQFKFVCHFVIHIQNLDSKHPILYINDKKLIGHYEITDGTNLIVSPRILLLNPYFLFLEDTIHLSNKKLIFRLEAERPDHTTTLEASKAVREGNLNVSQILQSQTVELQYVYSIILSILIFICFCLYTIKFSYYFLISKCLFD